GLEMLGPSLRPRCAHLRVNRQRNGLRARHAAADLMARVCRIFKDAVLSILATTAKQQRVRLSERPIAELQWARRAGRIGGRQSAVVDRHRLAHLDAEAGPRGKLGGKLKISRRRLRDYRKAIGGGRTLRLASNPPANVRIPSSAARSQLSLGK